MAKLLRSNLRLAEMVRQVQLAQQALVANEVPQDETVRRVRREGLARTVWMGSQEQASIAHWLMLLATFLLD
jgi:adenine C2-methylase RlmN of 23S rRNA A2503 and tRNA A37